MGLNDIKDRFFKIRASCRIIIKPHSYKDHPERKFSEAELKQFVKSYPGRIAANNYPSAISDSVLFIVVDDMGRKCELTILVEETEIVKPDGTTKTEMIIVCSAFREVKNEI